MEFGGFIFLTWFVGVFVSFFPMHWRVGLNGSWREFILQNPRFFLLMFMKQLSWPGVLIFWLANGRPESPWVAVREINDREVRRIMRRAEAVRLGVLSVENAG